MSIKENRHQPTKLPRSCLLLRSQGAPQRQLLITDASGSATASFESVPRACAGPTTSGEEAGLPAFSTIISCGEPEDHPG